MKNKRLWLSVTLTVLVVVCAMLILSRVNEARSNAAPAAPTRTPPVSPLASLGTSASATTSLSICKKSPLP